MGYREEVLADGAVAYWRLGEASGGSAVDETGNGHTGTYTNGPVLGQPSLLPGTPDTCVDFPGGTDHVIVPDDPAWDLDSLTFEAWINYDTLAIGAVARIIAQQSGNYIILGIINTAGVVTAVVYSSIDSTNGWNVGKKGSIALAAGTTYHLVWVREAAGGSGRIYVNGVQDIASGRDAGAYGIGAGVSISDNGIAGQNINGRVDEVAIYNVPLSPAQVLNHYNLGQSTSAALVAAATLAVTVLAKVAAGVTFQAASALAVTTAAALFSRALLRGSAVLGITTQAKISLFVLMRAVATLSTTAVAKFRAAWSAADPEPSGTWSQTDKKVS